MLPPWMGVGYNVAVPRRFAHIQKALAADGLAGWLFSDERITRRVLDSRPSPWMARPWFYWLPSAGLPVAMVHAADPGLAGLPGECAVYDGHAELRTLLRRVLPDGPGQRVAVQYAPMGHVPKLSLMDAGTVEMVRSCGVEPVSSGDLLSRFDACWEPSHWHAHGIAHAILSEVIEQALERIRLAVAAGQAVTECSVQAELSTSLQTRDLVTAVPPRIAVNEHTAIPGFVPHAADDLPIGLGSLLSIHLAGRCVSPPSVYASCMYTAFVGQEVPQAFRDAFEIARRGRDVTVDYLNEAFGDERELHGWEVDSVCRREIAGLGYGANLLHRSGYCLGHDELYGTGPDLDDVETEDDRLLLPGMAFAVEPGVYMPGRFGVRAGMNLYVDRNGLVHPAVPEPQRVITPLSVTS